MTEQKREWWKPKLRVLLKGRPKGRILAGCKTMFSGGSGSQNNGCMNKGPGGLDAVEDCSAEWHEICIVCIDCALS